MDTENPSAPTHAQSRTGEENPPPGDAHAETHPAGVVHDNARHTTRFTVIGNHLAQHPDLSGLAIGLAVHIQSLPSGTKVDIKTLAARFPEGTTRIAAALRELETHGYLRRPRERTESGRIVTRTISCNQPGRRGSTAPHTAPSRHGSASPDAPNPPPAGQRRPEKKPPRRALPAVPQPGYSSPTLLQTATDVLAGLRRRDPRLLLSATDAEHLAPGVAAWLEREVPPNAVSRALSSDLPLEPLHRPAAFLAHRLAAQLPPLPPYRAPEQPPPIKHPLQNCDTCDLAFRGPEPGLCDSCRAHPPAPNLQALSSTPAPQRPSA
ncbi:MULTISPECIES: helix-turn-helix domain-containing protein [unclassified Streptomyces]|uniref:helix-turn-helix domain-containing protein n=1 Tax=unclassified Streptomyces TaxID=2593676 RepID=UPI0029B3340D|nr:helix-turn-helix domain-containing protein [Streptomyces sp. FL07-04A]MDX3575717.1 helix-turn-helix domain-containing protein [Streptomyces sp. FL07-04A]